MKKRAINIFAILVCLVMLSAVGRAFPVYHLEITIPFEFTIKKQTFSAGKYTIRRLNREDPDLLLLRGEGNNAGVVFRVQQTPTDRAVRKTHLTFKRDEKGRNLLTGIWEAGNKFGNSVLSSDNK